MSGSRSTTRASTDGSSYRSSPHDGRIVKALNEGAFHLPGNNFCQDYMQYFANNHPLFSICLQHRLHPISKLMRLVGLIGSVMFGLAVTDIMWLWFIYDQTESDPVFVVSAGGIVVKNNTEYVYVNNTVTQLTESDVTPGMFILWTVGSIIHAIYDNTIWYAVSCSCCCESCVWFQNHKNFGKYFVIVFVFVTTIASTAFVIIRASLESNKEKSVDVTAIRSAGLVDDAIDVKVLKGTSSSTWNFLESYGIELCLAWFVYFPIVGTILFTGVLSCCGRISCLGGRPVEVKKEKVEQGAQSSERRNQKPGNYF